MPLSYIFGLEECETASLEPADGEFQEDPSNGRDREMRSMPCTRSEGPWRATIKAPLTSEYQQAESLGKTITIREVTFGDLVKQPQIAEEDLRDGMDRLDVGCAQTAFQPATLRFYKPSPGRKP